MRPFHIQIATQADVDAVAALFDAYRQFYEQPADLDAARRFIAERIAKQESTILLASTAQKALGFCQLYPTFCSVEAAPIFTLYDLFVTEDARRAGVGRALLEAAEKLATQKGKVRMDLTTAKTNTSAQSVYEALGWVRDDVFYTYSRRVQIASDGAV